MTRAIFDGSSVVICCKSIGSAGLWQCSEHNARATTNLPTYYCSSSTFEVLAFCAVHIHKNSTPDDAPRRGER